MQPVSPIVRRFFAFYRPHKKLFLLDFSCAVVAAILELSFPIFVNHTVDRLLPSHNWSLILAACAGLLGVYAFTTLLQFVVTYWDRGIRGAIWSGQDDALQPAAPVLRCDGRRHYH